jgi:S-adenosylmethionine:tRNA ribosyltransferase-isomerase
MDSQSSDELSIEAYDYDLPKELIAQHPTRHRTDARLMWIDRAKGSIEHFHVRDLPELIATGDTLVVNDTKVVAARLIGLRESTRGRWEGLFLQRNDQGIGELLSKTRGTMAPGEQIVLRDREGREELRLTVVQKTEQGSVLFQPPEGIPWEDLLERCGRVPLPPYIRDGLMVDEDQQRYQTVYARHPGSVAAPTAGLHLTPELIQQLREKGGSLAAVTLHVGIGTFRPIQVDRLDQHAMHHEWGTISEAVARKLQMTRDAGGRVIAVGTTSTRVLESSMIANQGRWGGWSGQTDLFIRPGFRFQAIDGLLTNFHLPKSSLLVLVSALAGRELILRAYREAIEEKYRFFSYGDCMVIV